MKSPCRLSLSILFSLLCADSDVQAQNGNLTQFEAQRQGQYAYTPFTAMSSPVVLPMDGKVSEADWFTGMDVSLGGILFPHLHLDTAFGTSSASQEDLQVGHHDPNRNGFTWQNVEFGLSGRFNKYLEAFGTYASNVDSEGHWAGIYEEWFLKLQNLDAGGLGQFELRGGRIYNRFGLQNTYHPHGFDWADQYLVNARLLGDDSLTIIGGDVTWRLPVAWTSQLDVAVGIAPDSHSHHHGAREIEGARFDPEAAAFDDVMTVANWTNIYNYNDFHQFRAGVSGGWGDNQSGRSTSIYGAHFEYQWRENGLELGGRYFRWRNEVMWRRWAAGGLSAVDHGHDDHEEVHHEEDDHNDHGDEADHHDGEDRANLRDFGLYSSLLYGFSNRLEAGLRAEYVGGDRAAGLDERFRLSPGLTYYINDARTVKFRVQYNYDQSNEFGTDHSLWGQVSISWGGPEVR
ncbi:MAG: hypothetical protein H7A55_05810 [Verrucomicrobiaceae bacterium]|nr:hypothetical protein [Verrucomicrobiaceae bacterium]